MRRTTPTDGFSVLKDPVLRNALIILAALAIALFAARAPTSYTGKIPIIGKFVPLKLNAVYVIVFGPILAMLASGALWFQATRQTQRPRAKRRPRSNDGTVLLLAGLCLIAVLTGALSLQYFLIFEPQVLQAWAYVLCPVLTLLFLLMTWRAWKKRSNGATPTLASHG